MRIILLVLAAQFVIETGVLLLALWGMVRLQKFQYHFWGLLGSAALASAFNQIPFVGRPLAVASLILCLMKVTREDLVGIRFTIGISYAVVFGFKLFLVGSLMGDLRVAARAKMDPAAATQAYDEEGYPTNDTAKPDAGNTNLAKAPPKTVKAAGTPKPEPASPANTTLPAQPPPAPKGFSLKGLINSPGISTAIIDTGVKTYSVDLGESVRMDTRNGRVTVKLEKVAENSALLTIDGAPAALSRR